MAVSTKIADHSIITVKLNLSIPRTASHSRTVWSFAKADWEGLKGELLLSNWSGIYDSTAAATTTSLILEAATKHIPQRDLRTTKRSHPWLTDNITTLVAEKHAATGTSLHADAVKACSEAIMAEYNAYCLRSRQKLVEARKGSKQWWGLGRELLLQQSKVQSIPALKSSDGSWLYEALGKADLLATFFSDKNVLPEAVINEDSDLELNPYK